MSQRLVDVGLGGGEPAQQIGRVGSFAINLQRVAIVCRPAVGGQQISRRLKMTQRRFVGGRGLRLAPGLKIEPGTLEPFVRVIDQRRHRIQMPGNIEQALVEFRRAGVMPELATDLQMQRPDVLRGDQRISRLLNPVMQKPELGLGGDHQPLLDRLPQIAAGRDLTAILNRRQDRQGKAVADAGGDL